MFKPGTFVNLHIRGSLQPIPGIISGEPIVSSFENRAGQVVRTTLVEVVSFRRVPEGRTGAGLTSYRRSMESLSFLSGRYDACPELDGMSTRQLEEAIGASLTRFQNPDQAVDERELVTA